jgi:D-3-phosphoglycerate dehydrogenase
LDGVGLRERSTEERSTPAGRLLVVDQIAEPAIRELSRLFDVTVKLRPPEDELIELIRGVDVLVCRSGVKVTAPVIEAASSLKLIARAGAGTDNIDLAAARRAGVQVFCVPGEGAQAVAEFAFGLVLASCRHIALAHTQVLCNEWRKEDLGGMELRGRTLGVVGVGRIGSRLAALARGFDMQVLGCVEHPSAARRAELASKGVVLVGFETVLRESDVVCLTCPLTDVTRNLIDAERLRLMRPGAYLVNVARGGVVNEPDLCEALERGTIAGAAADVFERERHPTPLAALDCTVLTPHIAAMTFDSQERIGGIVATSIAKWLNGEPVPNLVC